MTPLRIVADNVRHLEDALNRELRHGRFLKAYALYYDKHARFGSVIQTRNGSDADGRALQFLSWADRFAGARLIRSAATDDVSGSEWIADTCNRGARRHDTWVVARRWRKGRVVQERILERCTTVVGDASGGWGHVG